ncbi:hypothetical protein ISS06_00465 [Patescibacteria group bacterium]|nr:hypothetical protein [Patescibacteria group bacterium]
MNNKLKTIFLSIISFLTGGLGIIGLLGWCCTLTGAAILSFLGIASFSAWLVSYNKLLIIISIIFLILAIYSYIKFKQTKTCNNKNNTCK